MVDTKQVLSSSVSNKGISSELMKLVKALFVFSPDDMHAYYTDEPVALHGVTEIEIALSRKISSGAYPSKSNPKGRDIPTYTFSTNQITVYS